jgi:opacity protein-like surface antigen
LDYPLACVEQVLCASSVGAWRSLVAHLHGVQGVGGSNPLAPTNLFDLKEFREVKHWKTRAWIAALVMVAGANVHAEEWTHAVTPYIWGSGMSGKVVVGTPLGPLESNVDLNFGDIVSNLEFGAMVSYEGGRGKWVVLGDLIFMNLGAADTSTSGAVSVRASVDVEQTMVEGDVGYLITDSIALFAGARYNDIDGGIGVATTGPGAGSDRSANMSESWVDPVVGLLGKFPITEKLEWDLRADIGGFGVGSDFAWQAMGTLRWKLRQNLDLLASYRYMEVDFEQSGNSGLLVYDMTNSGFGLGMTFRF